MGTTGIPRASQQEWQGVLEKLIDFTKASEALVSSIRSALIGDRANDSLQNTTEYKDTENNTSGGSEFLDACACDSKSKLKKSDPSPSVSQSTESANNKPSTDTVKCVGEEGQQTPPTRQNKPRSKVKKARSKGSSELVDTKKQLVKLNSVKTNLRNIHVEISKVIERLNDLERSIKGTSDHPNTPEFAAASSLFRQIIATSSDIDEGFVSQSLSQSDCSPCSPNTPSRYMPQNSNQPTQQMENPQGIIEITEVYQGEKEIMGQPRSMSNPRRNVDFVDGNRPNTTQYVPNVNDSILNQGMTIPNREQSGCGPCVPHQVAQDGRRSPLPTRTSRPQQIMNRQNPRPMHNESIGFNQRMIMDESSVLNHGMIDRRQPQSPLRTPTPQQMANRSNPRPMHNESIGLNQGMIMDESSNLYQGMIDRCEPQSPRRSITQQQMVNRPNSRPEQGMFMNGSSIANQGMIEHELQSISKGYQKTHRQTSNDRPSINQSRCGPCRGPGNY